MILNFDCVCSFYFFVSRISLCRCHILQSTNILCLLLLYFYYEAISSSPVSSQDSFGSLPRDQSRDTTPRLGVSVS